MHVDLTQCYVKSPVTTSAVPHRVYLTWKHSTPLDRGDISGALTDFSSTNGALCAVKRTKECDKSHVDLTRCYGKCSVTTSAVLRRVYPHGSTPRSKIEVEVQVT